MNPNRKADINDPGAPGTMQRLVYSAARVGWGYTWTGVNNLVQHLISQPRDNYDTEYSLLLNALGAATEELARKEK